MLTSDESYVSGQTIQVSARLLALGEELTLIQVQTTEQQSAFRTDAAVVPPTNEIQASDVIVTGKVLAVRKPLITNPTGRRIISEHDPKWMNAVIAVESTVKGNANSQIVVRFPSSLDVSFREMPKFKVGQQGAFLLKRDSVSGLTASPRVNGQIISAFTGLSKYSFVSKAVTKDIQAILASE
jgi:hypothetical protein